MYTISLYKDVDPALEKHVFNPKQKAKYRFSSFEGIYLQLRADYYNETGCENEKLCELHFLFPAFEFPGFMSK